MSDTTLILQIMLAILKALNQRGEASEDKNKEVTEEINKEMAKLNS